MPINVDPKKKLSIHTVKMVNMKKTETTFEQIGCVSGKGRRKSRASERSNYMKEPTITACIELKSHLLFDEIKNGFSSETDNYVYDLNFSGTSHHYQQ